MLSIRLSRVGKSRAPVYRVVVMPKHRDPWANTTEILGHYNPRKHPHEFVVKADRVKYWISQGAEVSNTLWNLFIDEKIIEGEKKRSVSHISDTRRAKLVTKAEEAVKAEEAAKAKKEAALEQEKADAKVAKEAEAAAKEAAKAAEAEAAKAAEAEAAKAAEAPQAEAPGETPAEAPAQPVTE
ncbi:30S ribosomal protein S16 [Candidatus Uhrbacteria bacterium]|nr:30S ribosomal protein S16 [Candidatus Uhrbacteria bacterium]